MTGQLPNVRFVDVDAASWSQATDVAPRPDQDRFVGPMSRYLCLAHYGGEWTPLAVEADRRIVGHIM